MSFLGWIFGDGRGKMVCNDGHPDVIVPVGKACTAYAF